MTKTLEREVSAMCNLSKGVKRDCDWIRTGIGTRFGNRNIKCNPKLDGDFEDDSGSGIEGTGDRKG